MNRAECWWCDMSSGGEPCADAQESGKCPAEEAAQEQEDIARYDEAMSWLWRQWRQWREEVAT